MSTPLAGAWRRRGTTTAVTACDACGRDGLLSTVRVVQLDADGNETAVQHMGSYCARELIKTGASA